MAIETFGLYLVITDPVTSYEACTEAAVRAGLRYVQLRIKKTLRGTVLSVAQNMRAITRGTVTRLIINDDPSVAAECEADGVHLGQEDMPLSEARRLYPSLRIFGLSTHNPSQAQAAVAQAPDYCGVGPVFATPTKEIPDPSLGPWLAGEMIRAAPFTTVAIGGINVTNLHDVRAAGAINFAVVRPVCLSPAPFDAIRRLQDTWDEARSR
ncbi:MAG: thiamine phosphate synthase [Kiritimatiellaeota bacterium]|nr:thiamine phosphate synthase [Kiritimatiellota bacterium]